MSKIIGIDLGTSNSAAAVMEGGKTTIIPSAEGTTLGGKAFPSYVAFTKEGQLLLGEPARRQAVTLARSGMSRFRADRFSDGSSGRRDMPGRGELRAPVFGRGLLRGRRVLSTRAGAWNGIRV